MKNFFVFLLIISGICNYAYASDEPVELAAPKIDTVKTVSDSDLKSIPAKIQQKTPQKPVKKIAYRKKYTNKKRLSHTNPKKITVDYDKISKLVEYNYFDKADKILQDAIQRNPKDIKARSLRVIALAKQSKLEPAQNELNELLKKYPNNSNLHYAQGIVYYQRTASSNMSFRNNSQKLIDDAMKEFKKAIELDKNNARAYNAAGVISLALDRPNDAKNYFEKSFEIDKTYSMALDNLGTMDFSQGKLDVAEKKFKQSLAYNTQNTTAMYHLAQIAVLKQDYPTALAYLNNALAINSNSSAIYNLMGKAYAAQGNDAAAINAFKQSITVKPEFSMSYLDLANIYEKQNNNEFAIEKLKTILSIDPHCYDAKLKMADISLDSRDYKQASNIYSELVGVEGYNEAALKGFVNSYYNLAQMSPNKALFESDKNLLNMLDCINKAISVNDQDLELNLAKLKLAKIINQPALIKTELERISAAQDTNLVNAVAKGEAYMTLNDYKNAEKAFDSSINLSQSPQDDLYLSEIFVYHKQYSCAEKVINKILKTDAQNQEALSNLGYIQKCKKQADSYINSAKFFLKSKNEPIAIEYLIRSIEINPNNPQAHLLLAKIYEKQKNYSAANTNYRAYLGLESNFADTKKIEKKLQSLVERL